MCKRYFWAKQHFSLCSFHIPHIRTQMILQQHRITVLRCHCTLHFKLQPILCAWQWSETSVDTNRDSRCYKTRWGGGCLDGTSHHIWEDKAHSPWSLIYQTLINVHAHIICFLDSVPRYGVLHQWHKWYLEGAEAHYKMWCQKQRETERSCQFHSGLSVIWVCFTWYR